MHQDEGAIITCHLPLSSCFEKERLSIGISILDEEITSYVYTVFFFEKNSTARASALSFCDMDNTLHVSYLQLLEEIYFRQVDKFIFYLLLEQGRFLLTIGKRSEMRKTLGFIPAF